MSEAQTSGTKPEKMVNRKVVYALGLACIVLIALVTYFAITGISAQNSYTNLQNQNKQLQTWLVGNETLLNQTQADNANLVDEMSKQNNTISQLESNITNLENQIANDNATITNLENSINSTVKIASVTEVSSWYSTLQILDFTVNVTNNGPITVKGITVIIKPYPQPHPLTFPLNDTLDFGIIAAGANETQGISFTIDVGGGAAIVNSTIVTLSVANISINEFSLSFSGNWDNNTWVFPNT